MNKNVARIAIAILFTLFFAQSVYIHFERKRIDLTSDARPNPDGSLVINFSPPPENDANILLLDLKNEDSSPLHFRIVLNQTVTHDISVSAGDSKQFLFDTGNKLVQDKPNTLLVKTDRPKWILEKLEIRNMYGSFKTLLEYVILPKDAEDYVAPGFLSIGIVFIALSFFGIYGKLRISILPLCMSILFSLILFLPFFSKDRLLLSITGFLLLTFLCYAPAIFRSYRGTFQKAETLRPGGGRIFQSALVIIAIFCFYYLSMRDGLIAYNGNYSGFLSLSQKYSLRNPFLRENPELVAHLKINPGGGYDAQFFYAITFDPFLQKFEKAGRYTRVADNVISRYRRIGFPVLIKVFSGDQPDLYPKTMVLLVWLSCIPAAFFLIRIASFYHRGPYGALLYILVPAISASLRTALPEPIAASLLLGGFDFYIRKKFKIATLLFAFALLIRETAAIVIISLTVFEFFKNKNRKSAILLLCALLPYAGWRAFVTWKFLPVHGWSSFFYEPPNLTFPFYGIFQLFSNIYKGAWPGVFTTGAVLLSILLTCMLVISIVELRKKFRIPPLVTVIYALIAVSLSYQAVWLALTNTERVTFECFLFFILLYFSLDETRWRTKLACIGIFLLLFVYDWFYFSFAGSFRAGFLLN